MTPSDNRRGLLLTMLIPSLLPIRDTWRKRMSLLSISGSKPSTLENVHPPSNKQSRHKLDFHGEPATVGGLHMQSRKMSLNYGMADATASTTRDKIHGIARAKIHGDPSAYAWNADAPLSSPLTPPRTNTSGDVPRWSGRSQTASPRCGPNGTSCMPRGQRVVHQNGKS